MQNRTIFITNKGYRSTCLTRSENNNKMDIFIQRYQKLIFFLKIKTHQSTSKIQFLHTTKEEFKNPIVNRMSLSKLVISHHVRVKILKKI